MTQTYDPNVLATSPRDRIRFEISDTEVGRMYLEDEEIDSVLEVYSDSIGLSVLACIDYIIGKLSSPSFRVDWLQITAYSTAANSYRNLKESKAKQFGLSDLTAITVTTSTTNVTRQDAYDFGE